MKGAGDIKKMYDDRGELGARIHEIFFSVSNRAEASHLIVARAGCVYLAASQLRRRASSGSQAVLLVVAAVGGVAKMRDNAEKIIMAALAEKHLHPWREKIIGEVALFGDDHHRRAS